MPFQCCSNCRRPPSTRTWRSQRAAARRRWGGERGDVVARSAALPPPLLRLLPPLHRRRPARGGSPACRHALSHPRLLRLCLPPPQQADVAVDAVCRLVLGLKDGTELPAEAAPLVEECVTGAQARAAAADCRCCCCRLPLLLLLLAPAAAVAPRSSASSTTADCCALRVLNAPVPPFLSLCPVLLQAASGTTPTSGPKCSAASPSARSGPRRTRDAATVAADYAARRCSLRRCFCRRSLGARCFSCRRLHFVCRHAATAVSQECKTVLSRACGMTD